MTYHHTPGHPVADIYAEYLRVSEFRQAFMDPGKERIRRIMVPVRFVISPRPEEATHAQEHPVEAEKDWLGCTDSESDDPGGWTK